MQIIATKKFSQYSCKIDNSRPYFLTKPKKLLTMWLCDVLFASEDWRDSGFR